MANRTLPTRLNICTTKEQLNAKKQSRVLKKSKSNVIRHDATGSESSHQAEEAERPRKKMIRVSTIVPKSADEEVLVKVHNAMNAMTGFTIGMLNEDGNVISIDTVPTVGSTQTSDKLSFWIQDEFLTFYEEEGKMKMVDDSIGRIEHIAFSYYSNDDPDTKNSYNKIYVDLVLKLARVFSKLRQPSDKKISLKFEEDQQSGDYFDHADVLKGLAKDKKTKIINKLKSNHGIHKIEVNPNQTISFRGGNVLKIRGKVLLGYDEIVKSYLMSEEKRFVDIVGNKDEKSIPNFLEKLKKYEKETYMVEFQKVVNDPQIKIILIGSPDILQESFSLTPFYSTDYTWTGFEESGKFCSQGIYHLDLFITPAGIDEVTQQTRLVIGDPVMAEDDHIPLFDFTKKVLDNIANQLMVAGFLVYRTPLPLTYCTEGNSRIWFFASYNNCLVQYTKCPRERFVWMPTYGSDFSNEYVDDFQDNSKVKCGDWSHLKQYDEKNEQLWKALGFNVVTLTNYLPFAKERGATRCFSKVLYRTPLERHKCKES